jgi:hypothetical protein
VNADLPVNEKCYVGIHTLGKKSYLGSGKCLNKAIHKYGRKNFKRIDIVTFETLEEGLDLERYWIRELNTLALHGYNLCAGGEGMFNPSQEVRDRMGWNQGKPMSEALIAERIQQLLLKAANKDGSKPRTWSPARRRTEVARHQRQAVPESVI